MLACIYPYALYVCLCEGLPLLYVCLYYVSESFCVCFKDAYFSSFINSLYYRGDHIICPLQPALRFGEQQGWDSRLDFRLWDSLTLSKLLKTFQLPFFFKNPAIPKATEAENSTQQNLFSLLECDRHCYSYVKSALIFLFIQICGVEHE